MALGWDKDTVVVVDEAGMVATPDLVRVLEIAQSAGARVVMVGDPHQYGAVKARGGLLATLAHELPDAVELTEEARTTLVRVLRVSFLSGFALELLASISVAIVAVSIGPQQAQENAPRRHDPNAVALPESGALRNLVELLLSRGADRARLTLVQSGNIMTHQTRQAVGDAQDEVENGTVDQGSPLFDDVADLYTQAMNTPVGPWRQLDLIAANPQIFEPLAKVIRSRD